MKSHLLLWNKHQMRPLSHFLVSHSKTGLANPHFIRIPTISAICHRIQDHTEYLISDSQSANFIDLFLFLLKRTSFALALSCSNVSGRTDPSKEHGSYRYVRKRKWPYRLQKYCSNPQLWRNLFNNLKALNLLNHRLLCTPLWYPVGIY